METGEKQESLLKESMDFSDFKKFLQMIQSSQMDVCDPFFLSRSENASMALVSDLLTTRNYLSWRRNISLALDARNKLGFINGSIKRPESDDAKYPNWKQVDIMVRCWLLNSMAKELVSNFNTYQTARDIWMALDVQFGKLNLALIFQIYRELFNMKQGAQTTSEYYAKMKNLWTNLDSLMPLESKDEKTAAILRLIQFLNGLNENFASIRSNILMMKPQPTIEEAYGMILTDEGQRNLGNGTEHAESALVAKEPPNNFENNSKNTGQQQQKSGRFCTYCKKNGHLKENCFKLHGTPANWTPKSKFKRNNSTSSASAQQANMVFDSPIDESGNEADSTVNSSVDNTSAESWLIIQQELMKMMKRKGKQSSGEQAHFAFKDYQGPGL